MAPDRTYRYHSTKFCPGYPLWIGSASSFLLSFLFSCSFHNRLRFRFNFFSDHQGVTYILFFINPVKRAFWDYGLEQLSVITKQKYLSTSTESERVNTCTNGLIISTNRYSLQTWFF